MNNQMNMSMEDKKYTLDSYRARGNTLEALEKELAQIDSVTNVFGHNSDELGIITVTNISDGKITGWIHKKNIGSAPYEKLISEIPGADEDMIRELTQTKMMFSIGGHLEFVSKDILWTLSLVCNEPIGAISKDPLDRLRTMTNARIAAYLTERVRKLQVVERSVGDIKKVCGVFSSRYLHIKQSVVIDVIKMMSEGCGQYDGLGKPDVKFYDCSQDGTSVYVEFPEKAKDFTEFTKENEKMSLPDEVTPGVFIETSDTGKSSFTVYGTMRVNGGILYLPAAKSERKHTLNATKEGILERVRDNVFAEYSKLPNRLIELLAIDLDEVNGSMIERIAEDCKIKSAAGKFATQEAVENIVNSLNPNIDYTAYDVAMMFINEGRRLESFCANDKLKLNKIRAAFVKVPFFSFEKL